MSKEAILEREDLQSLVNQLTQELAQARRLLATAQQKLSANTRTLEARTQELTEARAALSLLLATLDASQDGMLAMGYFGRAMHYNSAFADLWRIPPERLANLNDAALLATQLAQVKDPEAFLALARARQARPDEEFVERVELTDGRILECHVMPQRLRGRRVGSVTCFRDITEQDRLGRVLSLVESEAPQVVAEARATIY